MGLSYGVTSTVTTNPLATRDRSGLVREGFSGRGGLQEMDAGGRHRGGFRRGLEGSREPAPTLLGR